VLSVCVQDGPLEYALKDMTVQDVNLKAVSFEHPDRLERALVLMRAYYEHDGLKFDSLRQQRALEAMLREDRGRAWLATNRGEVVGYAVVVFTFSLEYGGLEAELDELFLAPEARGHGVGRAVMNLVLHEVHALGAVVVTLETEAENEPARMFYRRLGFSDSERRLMRLEL
jgi:ribosomal protein S18 acetylase RimI-like enzyme